MAIQAQLFSENLGFSLGNSQELFFENGCGFDNFGFVPQQQQQQLVELEQFQSKNLRLLLDNNVHQSLAFSQSVSAHIERQRLEFEQFINLQNERLKMAMQEQRKQQIAGLIKRYEWKGEVLVKQKEEEIARAANRNTELHNFLKRIDAENQTWQRVAKENEAMIASLNTSIQRLRESSENAAADAESCCQNVEEKRKTTCKCCNSRNSCVVILPCRHLSSCNQCELFLDSCPLCSMPKKATIQALI